MFDVLCSNCFPPKIEVALSTGMSELYLLLSGCFTYLNLEWHWTLQSKKSICLLQSTTMPLGSAWEPSNCMSPLFHWEFSSSFSSSQRRGGGRGGATQIQRLICLLEKRNSRSHFLMRALIKSGGIWTQNGSVCVCGGGGCRWETVIVPGVASRRKHTKQNWTCV